MEEPGAADEQRVRTAASVYSIATVLPTMLAATAAVYLLAYAFLSSERSWR
jgi:hypothetical protein